MSAESFQALVAKSNAEKDRERGKALGKRFGGLRVREEKVMLLLDELRRFEADATLAVTDSRAWRKVKPLLAALELEMQGKG